MSSTFAATAKATCQVLFVGMNPGPWGMAQTGVPFGQIAAARDWLGIDGEIRKTVARTSSATDRRLGLQSARKFRVRGYGGYSKPATPPLNIFLRNTLCATMPAGIHGRVGSQRYARQVARWGARPLEAACDQHLKQLIHLLARNGSLVWVHGRRDAPSVLLRMCADRQNSAS